MKKYKNLKLNTIDGFTIARASKEEINLPYDILIKSNNSVYKNEGFPRVGVVIGNNIVPVSISDNPRILSSYNFDYSDYVFLWIIKYQEILLKHWNGDVSDLVLLNTVSNDKKE